MARVPDADRLAGVGPIGGDRAVAILLTLLSEEDAASIVQGFDPDQMRRVGSAMLDVASASSAEIDTALDVFVDRNRNASSLGMNAEPRVRSLFTAAVGNVRADSVLAEIAPSGCGNVLERLRWMDHDAIATAIRDEHPQVGALILVCLTPEVAAKCTEGLDEEKQCDLVLRAARLESINARALEDLEAVLDHYASGPAKPPSVGLDGRGGAAKIVTRLPKSTNVRLLKAIKKRDKEIAQKIEESLLTFEDLLALNNKGMGTLLRNVDTPVLVMALRGAPQGTVDQMLASLSGRAADGIRDELAEGRAKREEVEDARRQIAAIARRLNEEGEIELGGGGGGGGDDYV
jgi:flagellar motor switch protein FliG